MPTETQKPPQKTEVKKINGKLQNQSYLNFYLTQCILQPDNRQHYITRMVKVTD